MDLERGLEDLEDEVWEIKKGRRSREEMTC